MSNEIAQYGLIDWPFRVVPDKEFAQKWAGRADTLRQLTRLAKELSMSSISSLHVLWADFGVGKTHSLYHLASLLEKDSSGTVLPIYVVLPREAKSFLSIYQTVVAALPLDRIATLFAGTVAHTNLESALNEHFGSHRELGEVLWAYATGNETQKAIARRWIMGLKLSRSDLNQSGLHSQIASPDQANAQLTDLIQLLVNLDEKVNRILIMLDEFQRIGSNSKKRFADINDGLHTFFNQNPRGLSLIFSFSFGDPSFVEYHLNDELRDRTSKRTITLRPFSVEEAGEFIKDLLAIHRSDDAQEVSSTHPFEVSAFSEIIASASKSGSLTPRRLMRYFDYVIKEAMIDDVVGSIDEDFARQALSEAEMDLSDEEAS